MFAVVMSFDGESGEDLAAGIERMESCWANNRPAYRCRHGHSSATTPDPGRPKNAYVRQDHILAHLPALLARPAPPVGRRRRRTRHGVPVVRPVSDQDLSCCLRAREITLIYDPRTKTSQADTPETVTTVASRAS